MFIDVVPNERSAPAVLLRESVREGRKVHKRTIANLSQMPPELVDGLRALLAGGSVVGGPDQALEIQRSLPHGHVAAVLGMMRKLDLPRLLGRAASRERDLALALIVSRVISPGSKLSTLRGLNPESATSSLGQVLGLGMIEEREIYAALDWLGAQQARVERQFAKRHLRESTLVLYDVSSSYLEGRRCALARHGYSRDHRPDRPQIVYGLLCDRDGRPIAVEVFDGNTADPGTIAAQIDKLKRRFHLSHVVLVGDRGMITTARIRDEIKPAGLDWISCLRAAQIQELAEGPLQMSLFDERDIAAITSPDYPGERLIACRNAALAAERRRKREALLVATERELERIRAATRRKRAPLRGEAEIGLAVGAVIDQRKMAKHFDLTITAGRFDFRRNEAGIAREAALDGIYVIRASAAADAMSDADTVRLQGSLAGGAGVPDPEIGRPCDPPGPSLALAAGARACLPLHDGLLCRVAPARGPQADPVPGSRPGGRRNRAAIAGRPCHDLAGSTAQARATPQRRKPAAIKLRRPDGAPGHPNPQHRRPAQSVPRGLYHSDQTHPATGGCLQTARNRTHACPVDVKARSKTPTTEQGNLYSDY